MRDFMLATLTIALSALCSYGMIGFAMYEFDPGKWPTDARVICLFAIFAFCSAAADHYRRQRK